MPETPWILDGLAITSMPRPCASKIGSTGSAVMFCSLFTFSVQILAKKSFIVNPVHLVPSFSDIWTFQQASSQSPLRDLDHRLSDDQGYGRGCPREQVPDHL